MNNLKNKWRNFLFLFLIPLVVWSCTESPLSESGRISNNTITGRVELSDGLTAEGVHVWFKPFDISSRTDKQGRFSLAIPPASEQPAGGVDGIFYLYFYMANYRLDSVSVTIFNGNLQASTEGIKGNGELVETVELQKMLSIKANMSRHDILATEHDSIRIVFTVQALGDPVDITCGYSNPMSPGDPIYMIGFIKNTDTETNFCMGIYRENRGHRTTQIRINSSPLELNPLEIAVEPGLFETGQYKIIPHLQVHQTNVPPALLQALKTGSQNPCDDFFNVPIVVENNKLTITAD